MDNPFTCGNGHSFKANAKTRARCPTCGAMARRVYQEVKPDTEGVTTEPTNHIKLKAPVILRQGRTPVAGKTTRTPAQLANDKRLGEMRRKNAASKTTVKRPVATTRIAHGLVKTTRITKPSIPRVNASPKRTAVARGIKGVTAPKGKSFLDGVIDNFRIF